MRLKDLALDTPEFRTVNSVIRALKTEQDIEQRKKLIKTAGFIKKEVRFEKQKKAKIT